MRLLGTGLLTALIDREESLNPSHGATLRQELLVWRKYVERADWANPADVKTAIRSASVVGNGRVVFNICGNKYRLVVLFNYQAKACRVRFAGTHDEYDGIADIREI